MFWQLMVVNNSCDRFGRNGVVRFAQIAREVAKAAILRYRRPFSKHTFTQPTPVAILCLMRYEDWTYRKAEVQMQEHAELNIEQVPDSTMLYRCAQRIGEENLTPLL